MAEYIEREKVCELCGAKDIDGCSDECLIFMGNIPAADVVPVVRCKDCRYRDPENNHCDHAGGSAIYFPRKPDDFCSYGERKDGDGNG